MIYAIDPGHEHSALLAYEPDGCLDGLWDEANPLILSRLLRLKDPHDSILVIEKIESFGMAVGVETFETVFWSGRFAQQWQCLGGKFARLSRKEIKLEICGHHRANDSMIRQSLIDTFGPTTERAVGSKKMPGPLYGVKGHLWSALAVAVTWHRQNGERERSSM